MRRQNTRRLPNGRILEVHRNAGLRKVCGCARRVWAKCPHPWHLNFRWRGKDYRLSLDRYAAKRIESKTEAIQLAEDIRAAIRAGTWGIASAAPDPHPKPEAKRLTFRALGEEWRARYGQHLASARNDEYRLAQINGFTLPDRFPPVALEDADAETVGLLDVEAYRDHRKAAALSAVSINQDLRLLRKIFNWGIRKGLVARTPFKIGTEPAIQLEREIPRHRRFDDPVDEDKVLAAASPHLYAVIVALLETACRVGEILSLQWGDVSIERRELVIRATKAKTRTERLIPISGRLLAVLQMRRHDPAGQPFGSEAYVFGNAVGEQVTSVRTAWQGACERAGLKDLQLRDLRHEAGSRFDEAGVPINFVSRLLGHTNLTTTSRYLNIHRRGLHMAMQKFEESRRVAKSLQDPAEQQPQPAPASEAEPTQKPRVC